MRILTVVPCALGAVFLCLAACGDDDDAKGGASSGNPSGEGGTGEGGAFPGIDPATGANGTCPYDGSTQAGTATHGITIPNGHPRLWWTPERIERAKGWLKEHPFRVKDDEYLNHAFLHVVNGASCKKAIDYTMGTELPGEFGVSVDALRWFGEIAILTYDWCFDELTDAQKTTLRTRWSDYVSRATKLVWGGPTMPSNNYYWGYFRNEIEWGIVASGEDPGASKLLDFAFVNRWEKSFVPFAAGTDPKRDGRGGVPHEGTQYGQYHTGYPVVPFGSAHLLGRSVYDETEFFKGTVFYLIYATLQGPTTNPVGQSKGFDLFPFNDDEGWQNHNTAIANSNFMSHAAQTWHCLPVGKYARSWSKLVQATPEPHVASVDKGGDALDIAALPLDYYAPGPKYYFGRSAWGAAATAFHWQLGDYTVGGVGHGHDDMGSFQMWRGGRWLTRETASYDQTFTGFGGEGESTSGSAISHNSLLVDGKGFAQPSDNRTDGSPIVTRLESQPEYAYSAVDLTKRYRMTFDTGHPERDNSAVGNVVREMVFLRGLETLVVFDRLKSNAVSGKSAADVTKTFLAHFEVSPTLTDANHVAYKSGDQALQMTVLLPSAPQTRIIDEKTRSGSERGLFRVEVNTSGAAESYFLTVLQAKGADGAPLAPAVADGGDKFTVTLNPTTSLVFQKGMTSAGGSVTVNGATKPLRADVQGIKVTDAGPAWL